MPTQLSNTVLNDLQTKYFDDFDEGKRYYRILFRPSTAVQARELNQLQTILQNQVSRLGDYSFKDGSIVDGVHITYLPKLPFVRLVDKFTANTFRSVSDYNNSYLITNSTDGNNAVKAYIAYSIPGYQASGNNSNRWYLNYVQTGTSGGLDVNEFQSGDTLYIYESTQDKTSSLDPNKLIDTINVIAGNSSVAATGYGYGIKVSDGIIYQKGFFSTVNSQIVVVRDADQVVNNYVIGFETTETIVTENQDPSLNDNANGSTNYNAPGAHRLKLTPTLVSKLRTEVSNNFFAIAEFENSNVVTEKQNPNDPTSKLMDAMAKRTMDESGDYVVKPFNIDSYPAYYSNGSIKTDVFNYEVSTGLAYVKGYQIEKIGAVLVESPKATNTIIEQGLGITCSFGTFVIVNEVEGIFDSETLSEVTLYNEAMTSLSDVENASTAPAGSGSFAVVGYANVRGFQHYSGEKGLNSTKYALYLFNIRMNSGKSFATDVKSIYQNNTLTGYAKADVVTEVKTIVAANGVTSNTTVAVIKDSALNTLVFPTGFGAVKSFALEGGGASDSSYVFRQTGSGTLATGGTVTIQIDNAGVGVGGGERLLHSVGTYTSDAILNQYMLTASTTGYSANISGTVQTFTTNNLIVGTSTSFTSQLRVGEQIRFANATANWVATVNAIANATAFYIRGANSAAAYTGYTIQHYYPIGYSFKPTQIQVLSNTSYTFTTGVTLTGTSTISVNAQHPVTKYTAAPIKKQSKQSTFVKIDCSNNAATSVGPWDLGLTDVYKIKNIFVGNSTTTYANSNPERSEWFILDDGQRDDMYDHAKLYVKPAYKSRITTGSRLLVELDHFTANTSGGVGFFNVDSYPIDDANTSNTTAITTAEIPFFQSSSGKINLRNAIDFRPVKYNTATVTTNAAAATVNPAVSNTSFVLASTSNTQYMVDPNATFTADLEYYIPRYDLIIMSKEGNITAKNGQSAVYPRPPIAETDSMTIAEVYVPPYPSLTIREGEQFNRRDITMRISIKTTKRYTMRDISVMDSRLKRLEYYVVLNALEQSAKDMNIPSAADPTLNRFKNGIFADPFNSVDNADIGDMEYEVAIDQAQSCLRPSFRTQFEEFRYDSGSANTSSQKDGGGVTIKANNDVLFIRQPYATKYRNTTEDYWSWNGNLWIYPRYDYFKDEQQGANVAVNIDNAKVWNEFANSPYGKFYGDWRTTSSKSQLQSSRTTRVDVGGGDLVTTTNTYITTTTQQRTVESIQVETHTETYDLGNAVTDMSINPYMRNRVIAFVANNLKPLTTMHLFFDNVNVDEHACPGRWSGNDTTFQEGFEESVVVPTGTWGDPLVTDKDGQLWGRFKIPPRTFRTGDRVLRLANVSDLVTGANAIITQASGIYSASSMTLTRVGHTVTVNQPVISVSSNVVTQTLISNSTSTSARFVPDRPTTGGGSDPVAQSFKISIPEDGASGITITKVGVYFYSKDSAANNGITCYVTEVALGMPDVSKVVATGRVLSANVTTSSDASVETKITLNEPFLATSGKEYAFILAPDGNSPEWTVWGAEVGGIDVATGENVFSNPYSGVMFKSSNMTTWTPLQKEDLKFNIYRASYSDNPNEDDGGGQGGTAYAEFTNEDMEYITTTGFTRQNGSSGVQIGDYVYTYTNATSFNANTANGAPTGIVSYVEEANGVVFLKGSTYGGFGGGNTQMIAFYRVTAPVDGSNVSLITNAALVATTNVYSVDNISYNAVVPKFGSIEPAKTTITYEFKGTDINKQLDSDWIPVVNEIERELIDKTRYIYSRSNEVADMGGAKSVRYRIKMQSSSGYTTPVISLSRKCGLFVRNMINNDSTNEHTKYGSALSRYVSKKIVLADGQEAEDFRLFMTAYRPFNTDIEVYVKFWNNTDPEPFDTKLWTKLSYLNGGEYTRSSPTNRNDVYEYEFGVPTKSTTVPAHTNDAYIDDITGLLTYVNSSGSEFEGYKVYAIKVVLLATDPTRFPMVDDIRGIALQL